MARKGRGWHGESRRHSLARRGIPTVSAKRVKKGIDEGKLLIEGDSDLEKLAREMQDRNYNHYGDADLQVVVEALADVPEFGDPEMLYEARERFQAIGDELVLDDEEHEELNDWKRRLNGLIDEYEQWLKDEGIEREDVVPLKVHVVGTYTSPYSPNPYREGVINKQIDELVAKLAGESFEAEDFPKLQKQLRDLTKMKKEL